MNAHSAARAAGLVLVAGLAAGNIGCHHTRRAGNDCLPADCTTPCPPDAKPAHSRLLRHHAPAAKCDTPTVKCDNPTVKCDADCAPSVVEVRQTPPVHIKVPQQDVIVNMPQQSAPTAPMAPMGGMQPMPGGFVAPASSGMVPANVSHVPANRARLGFAFDTVRIRLPIIRPIAIPTVPEATFTMPVQPMVAAQPMMAQPMAVQPMAPAAFVQQPMQQIAVAPAAPQQVQFVQPAAPQQVQLMPVAPQAPQQVQLMPVAPVAPTAASPQAVNDYCQQVDALIRALNASKAAAKCP